MTWSLQAAGHAVTEAGEEYYAQAQKLEAELVAKLKEVLDDPKWGTTSSIFQGNTLHGPVHTTQGTGAATENPTTPAASDTTTAAALSAEGSSGTASN